jgi:hypothetical protein
MSEITGWFDYEGNTTLQHADAPVVFKKLFENVNPSQVLEIGTSYGGLTVMLRNLLDEISPNCKLRSYDILDIERYHLDNMIKEGADIDLFIKNVFNTNVDDLREGEEDEVINYIQQSGITIVLCDGGFKKGEFRILSQYLKPGDIIMAHDYSPNQEYFEEHINNKVWNWLEIQDSDIQETIVKCNLEPFMQEDFQKIVWVSKIKKNND